jgi:hypothetical protein
MEVGPRRFTLSKVRAPEPSVDLITAAIHGPFLPAGARALAVAVFTAVVSMGADRMAAVGGVDRTLASTVYREFKNGEEYHAAQLFNCCST